MQATVKEREHSTTPIPARGNYESLEARARRSIEQECSYAYYFRYIRFSSRDGVLTVRGCLPTFYLKQVLVAHLQRVDGVRRVEDRVDVISSNGLSSVRQSSAA